ncbi:hypothetical protein ABPG72_016941 [Tetrahymena utriculariae]
MEQPHQQQYSSQFENKKEPQHFSQMHVEQESQLGYFPLKKVGYIAVERQQDQLNNLSQTDLSNFQQKNQLFRQSQDNQNQKEDQTGSIRKRKFMPYANQNNDSIQNALDAEKSNNIELESNNYYKDHSIQKLNQSMDIRNRNSDYNNSYQRQKTLEYSSNSPVKLPSIVQHLYNSVNYYNKDQPATRYSQDTLKERHQRQKEIKQRLYQVMAPQESFYEQYNGFYHQNDYSLNVNDDLVKKRLLLENCNRESQFQDNQTFSNYIQQNPKEEQKSDMQQGVSQNKSYSMNDHTPMFIHSGFQNASNNYIQGLSQIRDEGDQVSTRYSQINEMNKFSIRKRTGASVDKKEGYSTNLPSSITSSKISCLQNNPSYSFIDHVNSQLLQMKLNQQHYQQQQQQSQQQTTPNKNQNSSNNSFQPSNEQINQLKKMRSITYDGKNSSPKFSQKDDNLLGQDTHIQNIKGYFNRKYNQNTAEPDGKYYPRYDYSEFKMQSNNVQDKHLHDQKPQLFQLRQRSSRSLLQDPQIKKKRDSYTFSFQNSQTEKFHAQQHKQNQQINPIEALQHIISEAANGPPIKKKSRKASRGHIGQEEENEDIILDKNLIENEKNSQTKQNTSKKPNVDSLRKSRDLIEDYDNQALHRNQNSQEMQPQFDMDNSSCLNNARIYSKQSNQNLPQNESQYQNLKYELDSTFNLQKELEKDQY